MRKQERRVAAGGAVAAAMTLALAGGAKAADAAHGAQVYAAQCAMCHGPSGGGGAGPALSGVVGRKAAAAAFPYSAALKKVSWTWDAPRLDKYLANPQAAVPGTTMPIAVSAAKDRGDLIAFMTALKAAGAKPAPRRTE